MSRPRQTICSLKSESESAIDLDKKAAAMGDRPSGVDIIAEALESGVDLGPSKPPAPPESKVKTGSDSDIDLESILDDSAESSGVDLGAPAKRSLPASNMPQSGDGVDRLVGVEDAEDAEVIDESLLLDSDETAAEVVDDDAELVTPKKKHAAAAEADIEDVVAVEDAEGVQAFAEEPEEEKPTPSKKGRDKERELVGAGSGGGRRRGGFMPFLLGGLLAVVVAGGGGAAAWYFDMLPRSPTAAPQAKTKMPVVAAAATPSKADQVLELIVEGKNKDALKQVENAAPNTPEAALKDLLEFKNKAGKNAGDPKQLEKANKIAKDAEASYMALRPNKRISRRPSPGATPPLKKSTTPWPRPALRTPRKSPIWQPGPRVAKRSRRSAMHWPKSARRR